MISFCFEGCSMIKKFLPSEKGTDDIDNGIRSGIPGSIEDWIKNS